MSSAIATEKRVQPIRRRFVVPAEDVSVIAWMRRQENLSFSLRRLVKDYIEKEGYTDPNNRPVRQLPRRGRPVETGAESPEEVLAETAVEAVPEPVQEPEEPSAPVDDPGSTPGASGVASFLSSSRKE